MKSLVGILAIAAVALQDEYGVAAAILALVITRYEWPKEWSRFISIFK